jgi:hypothetical protein
MTRDMNVAQEPAAIAYHCMRSDDAIRSDRSVTPDHCAGFDPRGWIDDGQRRPHVTMAPTSASATI